MELWLALALGCLLLITGIWTGLFLSRWVNWRYRLASLVASLAFGAMVLRLPNITFSSNFRDGQIIPDRIEFKLENGLGCPEATIVVAAIFAIGLLSRESRTNAALQPPMQDEFFVSIVLDRRLSVQAVVRHCLDQACKNHTTLLSRDVLQRYLDGVEILPRPFDPNERAPRLQALSAILAELKNAHEILSKLPSDYKNVADEIWTQIETIEVARR